MHLEDDGNRKESDGAPKQNAYMTVATSLNEALNGQGGLFEHDIDKKEVAKMIDLMLKEKKGVLGKGGYMERATRGRITRGLKRIWERGTACDYDGSVSEWNQWRRKSEEQKRNVAAGGLQNVGGVAFSVERGVAPGMFIDLVMDEEHC